MATDADGEVLAAGDASSLAATVADADDDAAGDRLPGEPLTDGLVTGAVLHAAAIERSSTPVPNRRCNGIAR